MNLKKDYKKTTGYFFSFFFISERKELRFQWKCRLVSIVERSKHHYRSKKIKYIKNVKNHQKFDLKQGVRYPYICIYMRCWILHLLLRFCVYLKFSLYYVFIHILNDPKLRKLIIGKASIPFFCFKDNSWHRNLNILIW